MAVATTIKSEICKHDVTYYQCDADCTFLRKTPTEKSFVSPTMIRARTSHVIRPWPHGVRLPRLRFPTPCPVRVWPQFRAKAGEPEHDRSPSRFKSHSLNACILLFTIPIPRPLSRHRLLHHPLRTLVLHIPLRGATLLTHHLHCERPRPSTTHTRSLTATWTLLSPSRAPCPRPLPSTQSLMSTS